VSSYYHKFGINDVFHNQIKTHPQNEFFIWDSKVFYNKKSTESGSFTGSINCVPAGHISLYEMNVDRQSNETKFIYPFIEYNTGNRIKFSTMSDMDYSAFTSSATDGNKLISSYRMSASISRTYYSTGLSASNAHIGGPAGLAIPDSGSALKNTFNHYQRLSPYYAYSSSEGISPVVNKATDRSCLINIPSIFYGSSIKKGTVDLKFYITGTLIGRLQDINKNGVMVQTAPYGSVGSGSVAGVTLYNEGFIYLSGSWPLIASDFNFEDASATTPKWYHFGTGANDGITGSVAHGTKSRVSASFNIAFSGTNYVPTVTMMAHAKKGELNHSNNWSYLAYNQANMLKPLTGSATYKERDLDIKNIVSSSYPDPTGSFQKITYISKIGIYDDDKNLIGIASLAKPVKKTEERDLTFKLKLDI